MAKLVSLRAENGLVGGTPVSFILLPIAVFVAVFTWGGQPLDGISGFAPSGGGTGQVSARFGDCGLASRQACVVDGDTIWYAGEKIRIADLDTPETFRSGCAREKAMGNRATRRMKALLNEGDFTLTRPFGTPDRDRYGRLLRVAARDGASLGETLVNEGLAEKWGGARINWCV